jgi:hypothetical protein
MRAFDLEGFLRAWKNLGAERPSTIVFDTTLVGPRFPLKKMLGGLCRAPMASPLVVELRSGLKLDQAGLELANVGIASLFATNDTVHIHSDFAKRLRKVRTIAGSGLTFEEIAVLEAPWFLDAAALARHTERIFANNAAFARALSQLPGVNVSHAGLDDDRTWAVAPFCVVHLPTDDALAYRTLEHRIGEEVLRRGLLFDRGGSFGFRGHRYEVVEPDAARGSPFLRIAMGARGGPSLDGVTALMASLLDDPTLPQAPTPSRAKVIGGLAQSDLSP